MENTFRGVGVALITPFTKELEIDFAALERLIEYDIEGGVSYFVALGTTAESATMTPEEKQAVLSFVVEKVRGRVPLMVGIGGNNTLAVAEEMSRLDLTGADAILSVVPYYNKPNQQGIYEHYKYLAQRAPLPLVLYNVPGRTGVNMSAETTLRLAHEFPNIIAVKEASGNMGQAGYILRERPENFRVISGDDNTALPLIALGGDGVISVSANAFPQAVSNLIGGALSGDYATARIYQYRLMEATDLLFAEGNPAGVKAALAIKGIVQNYLRLPLVPATQGLYDRLAANMEKFVL